MFSQLSDSLDNVFRKLKGLGKISEKNISDALREVRLALLEADVDLGVAKDFLNRVKDKALGVEVMKSITPGQLIVKIFQEEMTVLLGGDAAPLNTNAPGHILMVGLNGAGKTTTSAKLALHLKKQGKKPLLIALDLQRPAAIEQLATLAREVDVPMFRPAQGAKDVVKTAKEALAWVKTQNGSLVIFDTAGRQEVDEALLQELKELKKLVDPQETLLVADSATGQQAVSVASRFLAEIGLTGLVLTKLDGDARGGAALSMRSVTQQPIKFVGTGEKLDQLEAFDPARMAGRILGMGDVVGLVEKAMEQFDEKEAMRLAERIEKNKFDFNDFLQQIKFMQKLGPLEGLLGMMPGVGKAMKGMKVDPKRIKHVEATILSMTKQERRRPEILDGRRRLRIAKGAGRPIQEVNALIKQFGDMRKLMKNKGKMNQLAGQMFGKGGLGNMPGMPKLPGGMGKKFPF